MSLLKCGVSICFFLEKHGKILRLLHSLLVSQLREVGFNFLRHVFLEQCLFELIEKKSFLHSLNHFVNRVFLEHGDENILHESHFGEEGKSVGVCPGCFPLQKWTLSERLHVLKNKASKSSFVQDTLLNG